MSRETIVYISGPMTGLKDYNHAAFEMAKTQLEITGAIVLSPHKQPIGLSYDSYMDIAMAQIRAADVIHRLDGWRGSPGATAEIMYAEAIGKDIVGAEQ